MWPERPIHEAPVELNPGRRYEHGLCIVFREVFSWKVQICSLKNQRKDKALYAKMPDLFAKA